MKKKINDIRELGSLGLGKISECYGMLFCYCFYDN